MLFEDISNKVVVESYLNGEEIRESERMESAFLRMAMLRDDYKDSIKDLLKEIVSRDSYDLMVPYVLEILNIYKKIISRISRLYTNAPVRFFKKDGQYVSDQESEIIKKMYSDAKLDRKMKTVNRALNATNTVFLHPVFREKNGEMVLNVDVYTPDQVVVIPSQSDPSVMDAILIKREHIDFEAGQSYIYWVVWTDDEHYLLVEENSSTNSQLNSNLIFKNSSKRYRKEIAYEGQSDKYENVYGFIPFVDVHKEIIDSSFWDETTGADLFNLNIIAGVRQVMLDYNAVWQSFKQVACESESEPSKKMLLAPGSILWASGNAKFTSIDLTAKFKELRTDLEQLCQAVAMNWGVSIEFSNAPSQLSGVALQIKNQDIEDIWANQEEIFEDAEQRLWKMVTGIIEATPELSAYSSLVGTTVDLRFKSMSLVDEKTDIENDVSKMENGFVSPAETYMKYNEDVNDEEIALKQMQENVDQYNEMKPGPREIEFSEPQPGEGEE